MADLKTDVSLNLRFQGLTLCFAGKPGAYESSREDYIEWAIDEGAVISDDVDGQTDILVVLDKGATAKLRKKAEKLGKSGSTVLFLSESEYRKKFEPTIDEVGELIGSGQERGRLLFRRLNRSRAIFNKDLYELSGLDLSNSDLSNLNFRCINLQSADLRGASLSNTEFGRLIDSCLDNACGEEFHVNSMSNCNLSEAQLPEFYLTGFLYKCIQNCSFKRADLSKCKFKGTKLVQVDFSEAKLENAELVRIQCDSSTVFAGAVLRGADLSDADLTGVDLTNADLSRARLTNANLTDAIVRGAKFEGADLTGTNFDGVDTSEARELTLPTSTKCRAGKACKQVGNLASQADELQFLAQVEFPEEKVEVRVIMNYYTYCLNYEHFTKAGSKVYGVKTASLEESFEKAGQIWGHGKLNFESIKASSKQSPVKGKKLRDLAASAFAEVFNTSVPTEEETRAEKKRSRQKKSSLKAELLGELKGGAAGIAAFNKREHDQLRREKLLGFRKADLSGAQMDGLSARSIDLEGSNLAKSSIRKGRLNGSSIRKANLAGADLSGCELYHANLSESDLSGAILAKANIDCCNLKKAKLDRADLSGASLKFASIGGASFVDANLSGVTWEGCEFDEQTVFPTSFVIQADLEYVGKGHDPRVVAELPVEPHDISDFKGFLEHLESVVDQKRLKKAMTMLKKDSFQLFSEVTQAKLTGVVKSQREPDLFYACQLTSTGSFCCCTQNLNACGGLRGALCKHLLVLIAGLARVEKINAQLAVSWIHASLPNKPELDKDSMAETFLKHKGAEAGEIDWRPVETLPEDFYAF